MPKDIELAILFADVVGSTRLFELMGDVRARDMIATCIDIMRTATEQHNGTVIKTMGDEVMATFPSADEALNAAAQMQKQISSHSLLKADGHSVAIRAGCHYGPVVLENRDVFGSAVHTANRMTSQAKAGQIIITDAIQQRDSSPERFRRYGEERNREMERPRPSQLPERDAIVLHVSQVQKPRHQWARGHIQR